jgi:hypothetical protein
MRAPCHFATVPACSRWWVPRRSCRAALHVFGETSVAVAGAQHLVAVAVAAIASIGLTAAGLRRRDGRAVLLGIGFSTMTALLAVHGLATPGVLVGPNGVIALTGGGSLPTGAALLALTALPGGAVRGAWRRCWSCRQCPPRPCWVSAPPG